MLPGLRPFPFGPAVQPFGRVCMTTPHPHLDSSLPIVTCSTGRCVRLAAYRLSFPLSTRAYQFRAEGRCCLPFTGEVRVDDSPCSEYHLTHMDTQLSKACPEQREGSATFAAHLPRFAARFRANGSHHRRPADCLHVPRTVVLGWCVIVCGLARLACNRRRLNHLPLGALVQISP